MSNHFASLQAEVKARELDQLVGAQTAAVEVPEREQHLALLREAAGEIRRLRERLAVQDAKVATMELLAGLGRDQTARRDYQTLAGYAPDITWQIDRALEAAQIEGAKATHGALDPHSPSHAGGLVG